MSTKKKLTGITVETLVLVAVWETPLFFRDALKSLNGKVRRLFVFL